MFGRATIRLGIGPHSSLFYFFLLLQTCMHCPGPVLSVLLFHVCW